MNRTLRSLLLGFFTCVIYGQNIPYQIQKSEVFTDEYKDTNLLLAEKDEADGVLFVRSYQSSWFSNKEGLYFERYDKNLKLIKDFRLEVDHSLNEKYTTLISLFSNDKGIHLIHVYYDLKEKAYIFTATSLNSNTFETSKKELFRLTREDLKNYANFSISSLYNDSNNQKALENDGFFMSNLLELNPPGVGGPFSSKIHTYKQLSNAEYGIATIANEKAFAMVLNLNGNKTKIVKTLLFDADLNKKYSNDFAKNIKDAKYGFQYINLSEDGNSIYILAKTVTKENKKKEDGGEYQYELSKINGNQEQTQIIDIQNHFVGSLKPVVFREKISCVGLYSDRNDSRYKGISYFDIDFDKSEVKKSNFLEFTEQFLLDKYGKLKDKELNDLKFKNCLMNGRGEIVFNAEESYLTSGNNNSVRAHFDDIVSLKMDINGNVIWARNINKKQAADLGYTSFTAALKDNETYFFINAGEKVKELSNDRIQFKDVSKNNSNLNVIRINEKGEFDYQEILDNEQNEVPFMVAKGITIENSTYFLGSRGKKKQIVKVSL